MSENLLDSFSIDGLSSVGVVLLKMYDEHSNIGHGRRQETFLQRGKKYFTPLISHWILDSFQRLGSSLGN